MKTLYVFTDGAFSPQTNKAGIGMVFAEVNKLDKIQILKTVGYPAKNVEDIAATELLAAYESLKIFKEFKKYDKYVLFTDNTFVIKRYKEPFANTNSSFFLCMEFANILDKLKKDLDIDFFHFKKQKFIPANQATFLRNIADTLAKKAKNSGIPVNIKLSKPYILKG